METKKKYCGIDVSSDTLDICFQTVDGSKQHLQVKNNKAGFIQLLKSCKDDYHFVMEATGVYHLGSLLSDKVLKVGFFSNATQFSRGC